MRAMSRGRFVLSRETLGGRVFERGTLPHGSSVRAYYRIAGRVVSGYVFAIERAEALRGAEGDSAAPTFLPEGLK